MENLKSNDKKKIIIIIIQKTVQDLRGTCHTIQHSKSWPEGNTPSNRPSLTLRKKRTARAGESLPAPVFNNNSDNNNISRKN